jgi:hypothetical protein
MIGQAESGLVHLALISEGGSSVLENVIVSENNS